MLKTEKLKLVSEWDKTFPQSEKVDHKKVTFVNRYGITLAADLYKPKNASGKYPAIAVSGPFGAVKEQCSGLYAQTMAERGYLTIENKNSRDKELLLTDKGMRFCRETLILKEKFEEEIKNNIGEKEFEVLKKCLNKDWF